MLQVGWKGAALTIQAGILTQDLPVRRDDIAINITHSTFVDNESTGGGAIASDVILEVVDADTTVNLFMSSNTHYRHSDRYELYMGPFINIHTRGISAWIEHSTYTHARSGWAGGAMSLVSDTSATMVYTFVNCTFVGNISPTIGKNGCVLPSTHTPVLTDFYSVVQYTIQKEHIVRKPPLDCSIALSWSEYATCIQ